MSGASRIAVIGARIGGALAALSARAAPNVGRLALWDPVVRGRRYLKQLEAMHRAMLSDLDRFLKPRIAADGAYRHQLMGFPMTPAQREALAALDLTAGAAGNPKHVLMVVSDDHADYFDYAAAVRARGAEVDLRQLPGIGDWEQLERQGHVLFSAELVKLMVDWLAEGR